MKIQIASFFFALFGLGIAHASVQSTCTISLLQKQFSSDDYRVYPGQKLIKFTHSTGETEVNVRIEGIPAEDGKWDSYSLSKSSLEKSHFTVALQTGDNSESVSIAIEERGEFRMASATSGDFTRSATLFKFRGKEKAIVVLACIN